MEILDKIGQRSMEASYELQGLTSQKKNQVLAQIQARLKKDTEKILEANKQDMDRGQENGLSSALLDRLYLDEARIQAMVDSIDDIIALDDPIGKVEKITINDSQLAIGRQRTPLGVLAIIYESRPNVTLDASALALKSSNTIILRGGEEALNSNRAISTSIRQAIQELSYNPDFVSFVDDGSLESAQALMQLDDYVDVLIPRGGRGLIDAVTKNSTVPVIETGVGNSSIYVDEYADIDMAIRIIENAKCQRPGVCNAMESLYVNQAIGADFYKKLNKLVEEKNIKVYAEEGLLDKIPSAVVATEEDYYTEYLDLEFSIKTVSSIDQAIKEITKYGSGHSEAIITESYERAMAFQRKVNSACVYVNASTRFTDGGQFGLGAELGISTQKLHARGPVGLEELTSYKYIIFGNGQIRE